LTAKKANNRRMLGNGLLTSIDTVRDNFNPLIGPYPGTLAQSLSFEADGDPLERNQAITLLFAAD